MGGQLYVTKGSVRVDELDADPSIVLESCERYDPASNTWSRIAELPEPRAGDALACLDGSLYAVGGQGVCGIDSTTPPWRYDAGNDAWVVAPPAPGSPEMRRFEEGVSVWCVQ